MPKIKVSTELKYKVSAELKYKDLQANVPNIDNYLSEKVKAQISPIRNSVDG